MTDPLVIQLQADSINQDAAISSLLRKAKLAASKLSVEGITPWIDCELNGYYDAEEAIPNYRKPHGKLQYYHPIHGWLQLSTGDASVDANLSQTYIFEPISSLEEHAKSIEGSDHVVMGMAPDICNMLWRHMRARHELQLKLPKAVCTSIVDQVRNVVLNWALELEQGGILGEGLRFSTEEKERAASVTNQYVIHNLGVLGNVTDNASVTNNQNTGLNLEQVRNFVTQAKAALTNLPDDISTEIMPILDEIENEASQEKPDNSKLSGMLQSVKTACEGAAGNLMASGIISQLTGILS